MALFLNPLLALGFGNPLLLWGLAAASLPILLHLLNRRRFREVRWAAMRFLVAAVRKNQRRIRIEQWLLLAVRTALILCLVLGLAQPFLEQVGGLPLLAGQRTHRLILLDGSMSMTHAPAGRSRFDRARELIESYLKNARRGDLVSVILMSDPPRVVIGEPSANLDEVREEIQQLAPTDGSMSVAASLRRVRDVLETSSISRKELFVVTDLQASNWSMTPESVAELREVLNAFQEEQVSSILVNVDDGSRSNLAITDLRLNTPLVTANGPTSLLTASIRHEGERSPGEVRVRLFIDGRQGADQVVPLQAGEQGQVSFPVRFDTRGEHLAEVRIDEDDLAADNSRRYALTVREAMRVLLVDGDYNPEPFEAETDYLAQALAPTEGSDRSPSPIQVDVVTDARLGSQDLSLFDVVVLANVAQFTSTDIDSLDAFLDQGGGIVVFTGDQVVAKNYNDLLYKDGKGWLPAQIGPVVGREPDRDYQGLGFDALEFRHPIVAPYADTADLVLAGFTSVKTWRHHTLTLKDGSASRVAVGFSDGTPAIIEGRARRGVVLLVGTTADTGWTNWPIYPSYPPVLEQMAYLAASGRQLERNITAGQSLNAPFPRESLEAPASVALPSGELQSTILRSEGTLAFLDFSDTQKAGNYELRLGPPVARTLLFAVNTPPQESELRSLDAATIKSALPDWDLVVVDGASLRTNSDPGQAARRGQFHRPLLLAVLGLLLFESFLAWRMGTRR